MSRGYTIFGEFIVKVKNGLISNIGDTPVELGLTSEPVKIYPRYNHLDIYTDDFGPSVPVEMLWNLAEVNIQMTLVHYDIDVLDACMKAAMGGGNFDQGNPLGDETIDGFMAAAGRPMGLGQDITIPSNQYVRLYLVPTSTSEYLPYRFLFCYLDRSMEIPLGTERSLIRLNWRCIPYQPLTTEEISSFEGVSLWDNLSD